MGDNPPKPNDFRNRANGSIQECDKAGRHGTENKRQAGNGWPTGFPDGGNSKPMFGVLKSPTIFPKWACDAGSSGINGSVSIATKKLAETPRRDRGGLLF